MLKGNIMNNIIMCMWFLGNDDATREKGAMAETNGIWTWDPMCGEGYEETWSWSLNVMMQAANTATYNQNIP